MSKKKDIYGRKTYPENPCPVCGGIEYPHGHSAPQETPKEPFKNFTLGMFRQWFGECDDNKTYTAKEVWEMLNQACPLIPETPKEDWEEKLDKEINNLLVFDAKSKQLIPKRGEVKDFIRKEIKSTKKRVVEDVIQDISQYSGINDIQTKAIINLLKSKYE